MVRTKRSTRAKRPRLPPPKLTPPKLAPPKRPRRCRPHPDGGTDKAIDRGHMLKPDPDSSLSNDRHTSHASPENATTGDGHLAGDTSTVRSYVNSSPGESESEDGRKGVAHRELLTGARVPRKRCVRLNRTQLDVLYPPRDRAPIDVLYRWMAELSPRERHRRAPYCFRESDGRPRAQFQREFEEYVDRQLRAGRLASPPDSWSRRPPTPIQGPDGSRSRSPRNTVVVLQRWKGKAREPSDDGGRIRVLEERIKFMEAATQKALEEVARRQDRSVDKRIRWAVEPLREEQRRLSDAVTPLRDQIHGLATTMSVQMEGLKKAVLSGRRLDSARSFTQDCSVEQE
ncbi:uncharacterized protein BKCO1_3800036 [Diplodia corticola]|uniref:Uncharacterized protein n=1 Tax=Diplodia corticola TaxID=236234 RepID=A0A1J9QWH4_9PEZI|nr:uncharacterized protein BKCO1_3800036 [Diplodia corticola]OJD32354.1 hypothetical protein BKCO1_3800036 [Diplodia corticola]